MSINKTHFTAKDAVRLAGFKTIHMLNYLHRSGAFVSEKPQHGGRGKKRVYTFRDVLVLKMLAALLEKGISVSKIKDALANSRELRGLRADKAVLEYDSKGLQFLITDGQSVFFSRNENELIDLTNNNQLAFSFIVDMALLHKDLQSDVVQNFPARVA